MRQLVDAQGAVRLGREYAPYGETRITITQSPNDPITQSPNDQITHSPYGFTGEWTDATGLVYLRARYYAPWQGRFVTRDTWEGDMMQPLTLNGWNYVSGNPVNAVDPSGYYPQDQVHFQLTFNLALQEARLRCPRCLEAVYGQGIPRWVAKGDEHVDENPLWAGPSWGPYAAGHPELHFKSYERAWSDVRRMIDTGDPYLFGAALHGLQDYWSHTYEGYPLSGHGVDSALAGCKLKWMGGKSPCQRPPNEELAILLSLWVHGEIERPTRRALLMKVRFYVPDIPIWSGDVSSLTTSNLFDIWLRQQPGSPGTRKAAYWKDRYGYDTDAFYPFTQRDQMMISDTRRALAEYFDTLSEIDLCVFRHYYSPPSNEEIVKMLSGGSGD